MKTRWSRRRRMAALAAALLPSACVPAPARPPHPLDAGFDSAWARGLEDGAYDGQHQASSGIFGVAGAASGFGLLYGTIYATLGSPKSTGLAVALPVAGLAGLMVAAAASRPARVDVPEERLADARNRGAAYGLGWEAAYRRSVSHRRQRELGLGHTAGLFLGLVAVAWAATHPYT